jgi:solute carrier family 35, member E1
MVASPKPDQFVHRDLDLRRDSGISPRSQIKSITSFIEQLQEKVADSAPSVKYCFLCVLWYCSSAGQSNTAKVILNQFQYPVTLTFVQFGFVGLFCGLLALFQLIRGIDHEALFGANRGLRIPTKQILLTTVPIGIFSTTGHIFGSLALTQIPVSVVHTVKV